MNPGPLPFVPADLPYTLVGLITNEHYSSLMGLCGMLSAFVILMVWSRGL